MPVGYGLNELLDIEGRVHRILYVNCSCCGTTPTNIQPLQGMGQINYSQVCREIEQQNHLIDAVKRFGATKVVFSGCVVDSFPPSYIDSLRFLGCDAESLNLAQLSVIRTDGSLIDSQLAMAWQIGPWSENNAIERCIALLQNGNITDVKCGKSIPFGLNLQPNEAWISNPTKLLIRDLENMGLFVDIVD